MRVTRTNEQTATHLEDVAPPADVVIGAARGLGERHEVVAAVEQLGRAAVDVERVARDIVARRVQRLCV